MFETVYTFCVLEVSLLFPFFISPQQFLQEASETKMTLKTTENSPEQHPSDNIFLWVDMHWLHTVESWGQQHRHIESNKTALKLFFMIKYITLATSPQL